MAASHLPFPSLVIRADGFVPQGSFAEAQATFLRPDPRLVAELDEVLSAKNIGVVAHFYMDAELQGVLSALKWPHVHVADSLQMADKAVKMAEAGVSAIVVLGVDFMSENVRAVLDGAGHPGVPVYRAAADPIGCSLAESAEGAAYEGWLKEAAKTPNSLHVVYINTSLSTKARAHQIVPTITCTSSNVVQTILQAFAQIPDLTVWYGPDTYMGANLAVMFAQFARLDDAAIRALHPAHDRASILNVAARFHYFREGNCIVHHMFGADVVERVKSEHGEAYHTAHLEVPGEMFALAVEAQKRGQGVVGSTSDILRFIGSRVSEATARPGPQHLSVVLGTESGMITSIVRQVQGTLVAQQRPDVDVEIVFPVASEAVAQTGELGLGVVPGAAGGEGCSTAGGCATCPFMKMNDLDGLFRIAEWFGTENAAKLGIYAPKLYRERINGRTLSELGAEPIGFMRTFQTSQKLPEALVAQVTSRS